MTCPRTVCLRVRSVGIGPVGLTLRPTRCAARTAAGTKSTLDALTDRGAVDNQHTLKIQDIVAVRGGGVARDSPIREVGAASIKVDTAAGVRLVAGERAVLEREPRAIVRHPDTASLGTGRVV